MPPTCVADTGNRLIRKITAGGAVSTLAGSLPADDSARSIDGTGQAASFADLNGIAIATAGTLYVGDGGRVRKITPAGVVSTIAVSGVGSAVALDSANGIAVDAAGTVYVGDVSRNRIHKIGADGSFATLAGTGSVGSADGPLAESSFAYPLGLALGADGTLYLVDTGSNKMRMLR